MKDVKNNPAMEEKEEQLQNIYSSVNKILESIDTNQVTAESSDAYSQLPDGYYLSEVAKAEMTTSKSSGQPMIAWQFKTVEDGVTIDENLNKTLIKNTTKKTIFMYHVLKDQNSVERFISDALKFEGDEAGKPFLEKDYFTTAETLHDALDLLIGLRIWLHIDTDKNNTTWIRFVSWKRATKLELE